MKYAFIEAHRVEFRVEAMCRVLGASRSGFYAWRERRSRPSGRHVSRARLDAAVGEAFAKRRARAGSPRLVCDLREAGHCRDRKTVAASMKRQGLRAKAAKKFKATTNSKHSLPVAPNQKWVGDITYLWTDEGWLYLAVVIDLYSRLVVGWAMADRMTADLACDALTMALWRRRKPRNVIMHTDRGAQYCSAAHRKPIRNNGLQASMSAKGNCYDNAYAESFLHSLKVEVIHGERITTRDQMRQMVFEYIEIDYNRNRRHSANGYISPEALEALKVA